MKTSFGKALEIAEENGYVNVYKSEGDNYLALLQPDFFQALGKGLGWVEKEAYPFEHADVLVWNWRPEWKCQMHRFIDHLIKGKEIESFFTNLTN